MFTICQSCRLVDLDPFKYLVEIFAEIHKGRKDYANLRPKVYPPVQYQATKPDFMAGRGGVKLGQ